MESVLAELRAVYPSLESVPLETLRSGVANAGPVEAPAGARLFDVNAACGGFPLVLSGAVRVSRDSASGRALELYRVSPGEVCLVSAASLLGASPLSARGNAVTTTRILMLSAATFEEWTLYTPFRRFVFGLFAERLRDLMAVVDAVAFLRLDSRLAEFLLGHGRELRTTHQALADELGTVREMITRLLNRFEATGLVRLGRERIEIVDAAGLRLVATGNVDALEPRPRTAV